MSLTLNVRALSVVYLDKQVLMMEKVRELIMGIN